MTLEPTGPRLDEFILVPPHFPETHLTVPPRFAAVEDAVDVEVIHLLDERHETLGGVFNAQLALLGRSLRGVSDGAARVQVLREPSEAHPTLRREMSKRSLHAFAGA